MKNIFIYMVVLLFLSGCGLFETRSPESPNTGRSNYQTPSTYMILINNFRFSILEKNIENHLKTFQNKISTSKFIFRPSSDASIIYSDIFSSWDMEAERRYFTNVLPISNINGAPQFILKNSNYNSITPSSVTFLSEYKLILPQVSSKLGNIYEGRLQLFCTKASDNLWYIEKWEDYKLENSSSKTWSFLKGNSY